MKSKYATKASATTGAWIIPILKELITSNAFDNFMESVSGDYWTAAVRQGLVSDEEILKAVAKRGNFLVAEHPLVPDEGVKTLISTEIVQRYNVLPLSASGDSITVATGNPYDIDCEQLLTFVSGRKVNLTLASPVRIAESIATSYSVETGMKESDMNKSSVRLPHQLHPTKTDGIKSGPIIALVDRIIADAISAGASDIHCEPGEQEMYIRHRIDGVLQDVEAIPHSVALPFASRIKIMAHMDIADRLRPQGGRIRVTINGINTDLRVSTLPASHGEKIVIRILNSESALYSLDSLGLPANTMNRLKKILDVREGLILITGPTGSGKTTTLYAALHRLLQRGLNIITVEDPVEYKVPGIVQVQVNEKAGLTFSSALKSILRQDPDVVLIGEVRDRETAKIAVQAALTGHLVFATLHTIDACSSIARLQDLGVESSQISSALKGVIAQRLVRKLCTHCRKVSGEAVAPLLWDAIPNGATVYASNGCEKCGGTGYRGRIAVTEVIMANAEFTKLLSTGSSTNELVACARKGGSDSLWESGVSYIVDGITSAEEVGRVLDPEYREITADENSIPTQSLYLDKEFPLLNNSSMPAKLEPKVVDIYIVDRAYTPWRVLALQRVSNTDRPNTWEAVHGKMKKGELPEAAAKREVFEETGLEISSMYSVTVHSFYLPSKQTIEVAIVFCAFVDGTKLPVKLGVEHQNYKWLPIDTAGDSFTWPRAGTVLKEITKLLNDDTISTVEDVLRVI